LASITVRPASAPFVECHSAAVWRGDKRHRGAQP
jgi:hypothetical protein